MEYAEILSLLPKDGTLLFASSAPRPTGVTGFIVLILGIFLVTIFIYLARYLNKTARIEVFEQYLCSPIPQSVKFKSVEIKSVKIIRNLSTKDFIRLKFSVAPSVFKQIIGEKYTTIDMNQYTGELPDWFDCTEIYYYHEGHEEYRVFTNSEHINYEFHYRG